MKDVDYTLSKLSYQLQDRLGDNFFGLYLYGSLATGGFHPTSSDIDFLVITRRTLSPAEVKVLRKFHTKLYQQGSYWDQRLEGSYMPLDDLPEYSSAQGPYPSVNEGEFYVAKPGSQWIIHRDTLRRQGISVYGPSPKGLIKPISANQLRYAQAKILEEKWIPRLNNKSFFESPAETYYAVLTMARALYLFINGRVASKTKAAEWADNNLDEKWRQLVKEALSARGSQSFKEVEKTKQFITFTLDESKKYL